MLVKLELKGRLVQRETSALKDRLDQREMQGQKVLQAPKGT